MTTTTETQTTKMTTTTNNGCYRPTRSTFARWAREEKRADAAREKEEKRILSRIVQDQYDADDRDRADNNTPEARAATAAAQAAADRREAKFSREIAAEERIADAEFWADVDEYTYDFDVEHGRW